MLKFFVCSLQPTKSWYSGFRIQSVEEYAGYLVKLVCEFFSSALYDGFLWFEPKVMRFQGRLPIEYSLFQFSCIISNFIKPYVQV